MTSSNPPGSSLDTTYTYDNFSRVTGVSTSTQSLTFGYDQLSRQTSAVDSILGTVTYTFDLASRRTRMDYPGSFYVEYDYDLANEVTKIRENGATSGAGVLASYSYDNLGRRTGNTRGNGTTETATYDNVSRLTQLVQNLDGSSYDLTLDFTYSTGFQALTRTLSNSAYSWSPLSPGTTSYADNGLNQYTSVGGTSQSYDSNANLTTGSFGYDIFNRLTSGPSSATLVYDPLGRLFETDSSSTSERRFLYDGANIIAEYSSGGTLLRRYVHGPGVDEPIVWYEGTGTSDRRWLIGDRDGSIIAITNASGVATNVNTYDEYGIPGSSNAGLFQYTGQAWVPELGLYNYKARAYSSTLGRFMQPDPILYDGGMNLYAYVGNDPINLVDPNGTDCWWQDFVIRGNDDYDWGEIRERGRVCHAAGIVERGPDGFGRFGERGELGTAAQCSPYRAVSLGVGGTGAVGAGFGGSATASLHLPSKPSSLASWVLDYRVSFTLQGQGMIGAGAFGGGGCASWILAIKQCAPRGLQF